MFLHPRRQSILVVCQSCAAVSRGIDPGISPASSPSTSAIASQTRCGEWSLGRKRDLQGLDWEVVNIWFMVCCCVLLQYDVPVTGMGLVSFSIARNGHDIGTRSV